MLPKKQTGKVAIIASGLPSLPKGDFMKFLAHQGYVAIHPRYRGTWESGGHFLKKSPVRDIRDVIYELVRKKSEQDIATKTIVRISIKAIHLFGGSFGGPAVLLNSHIPFVKKIIAISPVLDWSKEGEDEPFDWFTRFTDEAFGGAYRLYNKKDWKKLINTDFYNPIAHTSKIDGKKVFILHAKDDTIVPYGSVIPFAEKTGATYYLKPQGNHHLHITHQFLWKKIKKFLVS